jgi:16S rRNA processing protein RimM
MTRGRRPPSLRGEGLGEGRGVGSALREQRRGGAETPPPDGSRRRPTTVQDSPHRQEGLLLLGECGRAHGLKGEVRLKSFTADPLAIATYGPLIADGGRTLSFTTVRPAPGSAPDLLIAQVEGVTSREEAEALNRVSLYLERDKFPPPDDDEFLLADLIGLAVQNATGDTLGTIVAVPNYGGGDLLEIKPAQGGATALLPFTLAFVPEVDVAGRRVVVDAPDDLFQPARPEPESPQDPA